jgi:hypothetical protein
MWLAAGCMQHLRCGMHPAQRQVPVALVAVRRQTGCSAFSLQQKAENRAPGQQRVLRATRQYRHHASSFHLSTMHFLHGIRPVSYFALLPERLH